MLINFLLFFFQLFSLVNKNRVTSDEKRDHLFHAGAWPVSKVSDNVAKKQNRGGGKRF